MDNTHHQPRAYFTCIWVILIFLLDGATVFGDDPSATLSETNTQKPDHAQRLEYYSPYVRDPGIVLAGFEDIDRWELAGGPAVHFIRDRSHYTEGKQSIRLIASRKNTTATMTTRIPALTEYPENFVFDMYVDPANRDHRLFWFDTLESIQFRITSDETWTNYFSVEISHKEIISGWNRLVILFDDLMEVGTLPKTDPLTHLGFGVTTNRTRGDSIGVCFDNLIYNRRARPTVVLAFHDGHKSHVEVAYPIMEQYGFRGCCFVVPSFVGLDDYMNLDDLELLYEKGWDIANHTAGHSATLHADDEEKQRYNINDGHQWLVDHAFHRSAGFFQYPWDKYNARVVEIVKERHQFAVGGKFSRYHDHVNIHAPRDADQRFVYPYTPAKGFPKSKEYIDDCIARGNLMILAWHALFSNAGAAAHFDSLCSYLYDRRTDLDVVTLSEYFQRSE